MNSSYQQLIVEVDRTTAALNARYAAHLQCRSGCSSCCHHHLSVFKVEAEAIGRAVQNLTPAERLMVEEQAHQVLALEDNGSPVSCPLLVDDRCSIYQSRPIICRTQGLPLLLTGDDGTQEVDWCPLNFTSSNAEDDLDDAHLVPLDEVNLTLALVNLHHSREHGLADTASGDRVSIARIILDPDTI